MLVCLSYSKRMYQYRKITAEHSRCHQTFLAIGFSDMLSVNIVGGFIYCLPTYLFDFVINNNLYSIVKSVASYF